MHTFNKFRKWKLDNKLIVTILLDPPTAKVMFDEKVGYKDSAWGKAFAQRSDGKYLCGYTSIKPNGKYIRKWIDKNKVVIIY